MAFIINFVYYNFKLHAITLGSLVWNSVTKKHTEALDGIQKRFLRLIYHRIFQFYPLNIGYKELLLGFEVDCLEDCRKIATIDFLQSILYGSDSSLLHKIGVKAPRLRAQLKETFQIVTKE